MVVGEHVFYVRMQRVVYMEVVGIHIKSFQKTVQKRIDMITG